MEYGNKRNLVVLVGQGNTALEFAEYLEDYGRMLPTDKLSIFGYLSLDGESNKLGDTYLHLGSAQLHHPSSDYFYMMGCDPSQHSAVLENLRNKGARFIRFVHPDAKMGQNVKLGEGVMVGPFAYVQSGSKIGDFNLLEMYSTVSMFSVVGDYNHLCPKSYLGPECIVGTQNSIGLNANIPKGMSLGDQNFIPAGACV